MYEEIINLNNYIRHLEYLKIDISQLKNEIQEEIKTKQSVFEEFWNRSNELMSPNINLENIIFEKANKYVYKYLWDEFQFDITFKLDMQSLIASKNSIIERPQIKEPSQIENSSHEKVVHFDNYVQIARFENELNFDNFGRNKIQNIIFQGFSFSSDENPFFEYLPSALIWLNAFYYKKEDRIIGLYKNFNSVESKYVLWINSLILNDLELELDSYNSGLKAINNKGDVILKFRCWRDELIDNGASFIGINANIAQLEGCDLILREDYFYRLKLMFPELIFVSKKIILNGRQNDS